MSGREHQDRHPFASGRAAADFHVSADEMSPDEAMQVRLLTPRQERTLRLLAMILIAAGMIAALSMIFVAAWMLGKVLP